MDRLTDAIDYIAALPPALMLAGAAAFSVAESGLGVGMIIPGETAVLLLAAATGTSALLPVLLIVVALGSSAGDHLGYFIGRRLGPRLRDTALVQRIGSEHWDRAMTVTRDRGAWAVFATRLLPIVRTLTPAAAGAGGVPYRQFLPASLAGATMWSALYTLGGAAAGESIRQIERSLGTLSWALFGTAAIVVVALLLLRRRRRAQSPTTRRLIGRPAEHHHSDRGGSPEQH